MNWNSATSIRIFQMSTKTSAIYDDPCYNYQEYWQGREYEDQSERIALGKLFSLIPRKNTLLDVGGGFGRLTPEYVGLFKKCVLVDPSKKLLAQAEKLCQQYKNLSVKNGLVEKLSVDDEKYDVIITVRTLHHLKNLPLAIQNISQIVKPEGFFILEFANKIRFKSLIKAIFNFNFNFLTSHQPQNIGRNKKNDVPFLSYHPNQIKTLLLANGFSIIKILSVSNFRHAIFKKLFPLKILLKVESLFSNVFPNVPFFRFFGPSVFILAQKKT